MPISDEGREALRDEGLRRYSDDRPIQDDSLFPLPTLPHDEREIVGEDPAREEYVNELTNEPSRPLTDEEEQQASMDSGRTERVYAPASARVPKEPAPGDDRFVHES